MGGRYSYSEFISQSGGWYTNLDNEAAGEVGLKVSVGHMSLDRLVGSMMKKSFVFLAR